MPLLGHANPLKGAAPRLKRLGNSIDAVDIVHEVFSVPE